MYIQPAYCIVRGPLAVTTPERVTDPELLEEEDRSLAEKAASKSFSSPDGLVEKMDRA